MDMYNVKDYGAVTDGKTNCASAIQAAVDAAHQAGGGVVLLPAGRYFSGSVLLKSNVELRLETGAVLISSLNEADILPFPSSQSEGPIDGWNGGFFLGARDAENITLSGQGIIDGQGGRLGRKLTESIRTGGQTGVDRAAMDTARKYGIPLCGWCPKNGWAEDCPEAPGILKAPVFRFLSFFLSSPEGV